jgi:hypothetical protein
MAATPDRRDWWREVATRAVRAYVEAEGAAIWAEIEARVGETTWFHDNVDPSFPSTWRIDSHHLRFARRYLEGEGVLVEQSVVFPEGRKVTAWVDGGALRAYGRKTEVEKAAKHKRSLYRSFLGWTGNPSKCGHVAERIMDATISDLQGRRLWVTDEHRRGNVTHMLGRPLEVGGPLDGFVHLVRDENDPGAGTTPLAIEVKNVRQRLYPRSREVWDLLAKVAAFPEVVPILIARRLHLTTFRMFSDIGALGHDMHVQWFSPSVPEARFNHVRAGLSFLDARRAADPNRPNDRLRGFFSKTAVTERPASAQLDRWREASEIVAEYVDLRRASLAQDRRDELWDDFRAAIVDAGLYGEWQYGGW